MATMPHELDPSDMSSEEAKHIGAELTSVNGHNIQAMTDVILSPTVDKVLGNEEAMSTIYRPLISEGTKVTRKNQKDLERIATLLADHAVGQVANNGGMVKNLSQQLQDKGKSPTPSTRQRATNGRTRRVVPGVPQPAETGSGTATQSVPSPPGDGFGGGGAISPIDHIVNNVLGPPDVGTVPSDQPEPVVQTETPPTSVPPQIVPTQRTNFPIGPPAAGTKPPSPGPWGVNPACAEVGPRMVFIEGTGWTCVDRNGNPIDPKCCVKPAVGGDTCGVVPPLPVGIDPVHPLCPKPTLPCNNGYDWIFDAGSSVWVCSPLPGTSPGGIGVADCQDMVDNIRIVVNASCDQLPANMQQTLKACGFHICYSESVATEPGESKLNPQWPDLYDRTIKMFFPQSPTM